MATTSPISPEGSSVRAPFELTARVYGGRFLVHPQLKKKVFFLRCRFNDEVLETDKRGGEEPAWNTVRESLLWIGIKFH